MNPDLKEEDFQFKPLSYETSPLPQTPGRVDNKSNSMSTNNSPRSQGPQAFQKDIPFPVLRSHKDKKKQLNSSFKEVNSVVKEEFQQNEDKHQIRHFKLMSDHDEFNRRASSTSKLIPRGKSLGALGKVEEDRQQEFEVKTRKRKRSRIGSFVDKNEFNKEQTGLMAKEESFASSLPPVQLDLIHSIVEIEESKQGLTVTMTPRSSSLNLIVDEIDRPPKPREQLPTQIIESIEQQKAEEQKEQPLLRVQLQRLQEEKELMKKIIRSETMASDTANLQSENVSMLTTQSIKEEETEEHIEDEK